MIFWLVVGLLQLQGWQDFFPGQGMDGSAARVSVVSADSDPVALEVMAATAGRTSIRRRFLTRAGTHCFLRGRYMKAAGYYAAGLMGRKASLSRLYDRRGFYSVRFGNSTGWGLVVALFTAGRFARACEVARFLGIDVSVLTGSMSEGHCLWVEIVDGTCSRQSNGSDAVPALPPELEGMDARYMKAVLMWASEGDTSALSSLMNSGSPWSVVLRRFFEWQAGHPNVCPSSDH